MSLWFVAVTTEMVVMLSDRGVCAVVDERSGEFTVMIVEDGEVHLGDEVRGMLSATGRAEVLNVTQKKNIRVTIDDWGCGRIRALDFVRMIKSPGKIWYARGYP